MKSAILALVLGGFIGCLISYIPYRQNVQALERAYLPLSQEVLRECRLKNWETLTQMEIFLDRAKQGLHAYNSGQELCNQLWIKIYLVDYALAGSAMGVVFSLAFQYSKALKEKPVMESIVQ